MQHIGADSVGARELGHPRELMSTHGHPPANPDIKDMIFTLAVFEIVPYHGYSAVRILV